jgi:hypothetical protein
MKERRAAFGAGRIPIQTMGHDRHNTLEKVPPDKESWDESPIRLHASWAGAISKTEDRERVVTILNNHGRMARCRGFFGIGTFDLVLFSSGLLLLRAIRRRKRKSLLRLRHRLRLGVCVPTRYLD